MKKHDSKVGANENAEDRMAEDEAKILDELGIFGDSRRQYLGQMSVAGGAILAAQMLNGQQIFAHSLSGLSAQTVENSIKVVFKVNGAEKSLNVDSRMTLLDALRERLELTGSKKGCDHGQCGACTMIVEGRRVLSCLTLAATCEGKSVTTIEGLAKGDDFLTAQIVAACQSADSAKTPTRQIIRSCAKITRF